MTEREQYIPGPANGAEVRKGLVPGDQEKWTLVLVRELRHTPEKVWEAITDPSHLREWAPFVVDANMGQVGTVNLTWVGAPQQAQPTKVTRAEPPTLLECGDMRWELEPTSRGTRVTLWHNIDRRFITWGAAGWHISFDVLDRLLAGNPIGRVVGSDLMKFEGWKRLTVEYGELFAAQTAKSASNEAPES